MCEVIVNPEGQREDVGQICQRQVDHEDHRFGVLTGGKTGSGVSRAGRTLVDLVLMRT